jgi:hypothetical protein
MLNSEDTRKRKTHLLPHRNNALRPRNDVEVAWWSKLTQAYFGGRALQPPALTYGRQSGKTSCHFTQVQLAGPPALALVSRGLHAHMAESAVRAGQSSGSGSTVCVMRTSMSHHVPQSNPFLAALCEMNCAPRFALLSASLVANGEFKFPETRLCAAHASRATHCTKREPQR